jgi:O-antigen/teichoic acid export membrane protein
LGTAVIVDGLARCVAVAMIVVLGGQAAGGLTGAFVGQIAALVIGLWVTRDLWRGAKAPFDWRPWFRRVIPLTLAFSSVLLMMAADAIFVPYLFSPDEAKYYMHAQIIGVALLSFTTPLAAVMFPKIVASAQRAHRSDALRLALGATALLLGTAAIACTLFPELPLRILFFSKPWTWKAGELVPWFAWVLLPLILTNVLVNNLMARERFGVAPWLAVVALNYGCALYLLRWRLLNMEMYAAFKMILGTLGVFSVIMFSIALLFTWRDSDTVERNSD